MEIKTFQFNMFPVNTYVVWDKITKDAAIIDPGMYFPNEADALFNFISDNNLHIIHLLNTHEHLDHVFGNVAVHKKYGVGLEANKYDEPLIGLISKSCELWRIPYNETPLNIENYINDGDKINIGNEDLIAIHVPGHSPGSIAFYAPKSGYALVGDVIFKESVGRTDLHGGNQQQLIDSISSKLLTLPDNTILYPGHGEYTSVKHEKENNPFF